MEISPEVQEAVDLSIRSNYLNKDIPYLKNISIIEYDIHAAGFSVIKHEKLFSQSEIEELENLSKYERNVRIGLRMRKDPKIAEAVNNVLAKVRKSFIIHNQIPGRNILSIKKDALFLIKENCTHLKFGNDFQFAKKNVYSSYAYLSGVEFYFKGLSNSLDIKGLSEEAMKKNQAPLKQLAKLFEQAEKLEAEILFTLYKQFVRKYLNKECDLEIYREIETGCFRYKNYLLDAVDENMLKDIDISQNYLKYFLPFIQNVI